MTEPTAHTRPAVPVTLLTGFLGAGKTTLLNRILQADHGLRIAVIVNDFGSINIDSQLVVGVEGAGGAINLANGCICCTIRDDLLTTALDLLQRPEPPDSILVEASGVSDPWTVADTFLLPQLRAYLQLDSIITVADAETVRNPHEYADLVIDQLSAADIVVLNKVDLVDPTELETIRVWIRQLVPRARILNATHAQVPLELLLDVGHYQLRSSADQQHPHAHHNHDHHNHNHDHTHDHSAAFATWSFTADVPFALERFKAIISSLPPGIFRAKGIIWIAEIPQKRAILQAVGPRVELRMGDPWDEAPRQSQLVCIGLPTQFDPPSLEARFRSALVS